MLFISISVRISPWRMCVVLTDPTDATRHANAPVSVSFFTNLLNRNVSPIHDELDARYPSPIPRVQRPANASENPKLIATWSGVGKLRAIQFLVCWWCQKFNRPLRRGRFRRFAEINTALCEGNAGITIMGVGSFFILDVVSTFRCYVCFGCEAHYVQCALVCPPLFTYRGIYIHYYCLRSLSTLYFSIFF